jgi:hypothetical protein
MVYHIVATNIKQNIEVDIFRSTYILTEDGILSIKYRSLHYKLSCHMHGMAHGHAMLAPTSQDLWSP